MDDFIAPPLGIKTALQLYIILAAKEGELARGSYQLYSALRAYLYERLSIEEMESPETLLSRLDEG